MFDIGWSELVIIAAVALIAIGPKELPRVLRMVGQWIGKARKMAAEFQGQFQEAMREAEVADLKKSFDEVKDAATGFTGANVMTELQKDVTDALAIDKPADTSVSGDVAESVTTSESTTSPPQSFVEAETHAAADEPLAIVRETQPAPQEQAAAAEATKEAKAS